MPEEFSLVAEVIKQLPFVGVMFVMVVYFIREMRHLREQHANELQKIREEYASERKAARDDYMKTLSEYRETIKEAIVIVRELHVAISKLNHQHGNHPR